MKKAVCLLGSPRRGGNSETISDKVLETAGSQGFQVEKFALNELTFKGCQACMACKAGSETCVIKDDLAEVLDAVLEADVLIMASPIYFGEITGQLKCALDRMYSFLKPDFLTRPDPSRLAPGKKCVFVLTQANPEEKDFDIYPRYEWFFRCFGYDMHLIRGLGMMAKTAASEDADIMRQAEEVGKKLV